MTNENQIQAPESSKANGCACACQPCNNCESLDAYQEKLKKKKQDFINSLDKTPIESLGLKVGDVVTFTNDYGVVFPGKVITGFDPVEKDYTKRFIYFDSDAYWFPHKLSEISKEEPNTMQGIASTSL